MHNFEEFLIKNNELNSQIREFFLAYMAEDMSLDTLLDLLWNIESIVRNDQSFAGKEWINGNTSGLWFRFGDHDNVSTTVWDLKRHLSEVRSIREKMLQKIQHGLMTTIISYVS